MLVRDSFVRYYCTRRRGSTTDRAPVTIYQDSWAYCASGHSGPHTWTPIEPTTYAELAVLGPSFAGLRGWHGRRLLEPVS